MIQQTNTSNWNCKTLKIGAKGDNKILNENGIVTKSQNVTKCDGNIIITARIGTNEITESWDSERDSETGNFDWFEQVFRIEHETDLKGASKSRSRIRKERRKWNRLRRKRKRKIGTREREWKWENLNFLEKMKEENNSGRRKTKLNQERNQEGETESESVKKEEKMQENKVRKKNGMRRKKMKVRKFYFLKKMQRKISFNMDTKFAIIPS